MPNAVTVRVGLYNPSRTGPDVGYHADPDGEAPMREQLALLASLELDLVGIVQVPCAPDDLDCGPRVADRLEMAWHAVIPSPFYDHGIAVLARTGGNLEVVAEHHQTGKPWAHCLAAIDVRVKGRRLPLRFLVGHAATSPTARLTEAEHLATHLESTADTPDIVYAADFRAAALGESPDTSRASADHAAAITDTRPAAVLHRAGLLDVGEATSDHAPTIGHDPADPVAYRRHRIHSTLPASAVTGHGIVDEDRPLSRHRPVWAQFTLDVDDDPGDPRASRL
ncbi:hypothetical protein ACFOY4_41345 [Actinomadura syzygii]|uniref:Endonuclease/exonuclease/phosphatase family protein n=1 Tax=Actinomadura syzygii TaxID=1427538 RepID=A0A5D0TNY4_9ACTN|nr:hypothetical protein [Actinomadura syzygii]TYC07574.1 hypothetical protein FXF65_41950 [Actinomadura syzygii]